MHRKQQQNEMLPHGTNEMLPNLPKRNRNMMR